MIFKLKEQPTVPLEAESLSPDVIAPLAMDAVCGLPLYLGKRRCRVDDFFDVTSDPGESANSDHVQICGDARKVKLIGRGMTHGHIDVVGNVGMHLGASMKGGAIHVHGDAGDWAGAEMSGGVIRIDGNAGGQIGAAYRGSMAGMRGGTILIGGGAGLEVGMRMKRGLIAIKGRVRDFAGLQMKGGTIVLLGGAEIRTGAWMMRGTIISLAPIPLLPTFAYACQYDPTFLRIYARQLSEFGFQIPCNARAGSYHRYSGDTSVPGKGEILLWQAHAS